MDYANILTEIAPILALFEQAGLIPYLYLDVMSRAVSAIVSFIHGLFYF